MEVLHDLRPRCRPIVRSVAGILLAAALACGGDAREGLTADSAVVQNRDSIIGRTPDSTAAVIDSIPRDSTQVDSAAIVAPTLVLLADSAAGDVLYRRKGKCLSCHGLAGKGLDGLGANLQDDQWLHGDGSIPFIQRTIVEGIARPAVSPVVMPAFATTLTPEEVYRIAAYVYTLSHPGAAVADTTRVPIDTVPPIDTLPPASPVAPPPVSGILPSL
jgi:mono/diheme cytochrome c family protein